MPAQTPLEKQTETVRLYQEGKTYSQIEKATGLRGPVIAKIVKKAGLSRKAPASPIAASASNQVATTAPPAASPSRPAQPSSSAPTTGSDWLTEFQPPAPKESRRVQAYRADCCGAQFTLDPGEKLADVTTCPAGCGGVP